MRGPRPLTLLLLSVLCLSTIGVAGALSGPSQRDDWANGFSESRQAEVLSTFSSLPLSFEPNRGQADPRAEFFARGLGYTLYLLPDSAWLTLHGHGQSVALEVAFVGANPSPEIAGTERLPARANYFTGPEPRRWLRGIPTYAKVRYRELWEGIDLLYRGTRQRAEYDLIVAPGADPGAVSLRFAGQERLRLNEGGDLVIRTALGPVVQGAPFLYQEAGGTRIPVEGGFRLRGDTVRFSVGTYDRSRPLVIDPATDLSYSTFLGGSGDDYGFGTAVDGSGNVYVTGDTSAAGGFPATTGAFDTTHNGNIDAFLAKLSPSGDLLYSTFLGGAADDTAWAIAVDGAGNAYLTGETASTGFPTTPGAFDTSQNGNVDVFLSKISPAGGGATDLSYSTFVGGSDLDIPWAIAVDDSGNACLTGRTLSANFPSTAGAFDPSHNGDLDAFVTKISTAGGGAGDLAYSTYVGGSGSDIGFGIGVDGSGSAYVIGRTTSTDLPTTTGAFDPSPNGGPEAFFTKITRAGGGVADLAYSTYLGGNSGDIGTAIAVDASGKAYLIGRTRSTNFPVTAGAFDPSHNGEFDAFFAKLDPSGWGTADLSYSTFLGGSAFEAGRGVALDGSGSAFLIGETVDGATDVPTTASAFDTSHNGAFDAFFSRINPAGAGTADLSYSTFLGGSGDDLGYWIAWGGPGTAYLTGVTDSTAFPVTTGALDPSYNGGYDAFLAKFVLAPASTPTSSPSASPSPPSSPTPSPSPTPSASPGPGPGCTLSGTPNDDIIKGTTGNDVICGLGGNDQIDARAGDDTLLGGEGNDVLVGNVGADDHVGEGGDDNLKAVDNVSGNDSMDGGDGFDKCNGDPGDTKVNCP